MANFSIYLNFQRQTEEAFTFYKSIFGGEFSGGGIARFGDLPHFDGNSQFKEGDKNLIMHIELQILGGLTLMGSDTTETTGLNLVTGNNIHINLEPDTRLETDELFNKLATGGKVTMELTEMFWGSYYGTCTDKFGIQWMFNCKEKIS